MKEFGRYHPLVSFTYFLCVILFSMFLMHPICLAISLISSVTFSVLLRGIKGAKFDLFVVLPIMIAAALVNPLFNHQGATILAYFPSGNPLTAESVIYGAAAAVMIVSVICIFSCFNEIMTADKFMWLFGKIMPSFSLVLSMTLRYVPRFASHQKNVRNARKCAGMAAAEKVKIGRLRNAFTIFSAMLTWSTENAIETADSMKNRGYGLSGRTAYSIYYFGKKDIFVLTAVILSALYVLAGVMTGNVHFVYFPQVGGTYISGYTISIFASYFLLCFIPIITGIAEEIKWKSLR